MARALRLAGLCEYRIGTASWLYVRYVVDSAWSSARVSPCESAPRTADNCRLRTFRTSFSRSAAHVARPRCMRRCSSSVEGGADGAGPGVATATGTASWTTAVAVLSSPSSSARPDLASSSSSSSPRREIAATGTLRFFVFSGGRGR